MRSQKSHSVEEGLAILDERSRVSPTLSIKEILEILSGTGRLLILIILSLPFCQPIQIPGFSTPFGIVIALIALRMAFGKNIWLPKKVLSKTVSSKTIQKMTQKSLRVMQKMRRFIHPRLNMLCEKGVIRVFNSLLICVQGVFLALPLPIPLSNIAAGWAILFLSLGLLEDDGLFVLFGYAISLLTFIFFILLLLSFKLFAFGLFI